MFRVEISLSIVQDFWVQCLGFGAYPLMTSHAVIESSGLRLIPLTSHPSIPPSLFVASDEILQKDEG